MKSSISRRLPTMLSIAFGEAGWRHPEGRFNIEPVCCSCSGRLGVNFAITPFVGFRSASAVPRSVGGKRCQQRL